VILVGHTHIPALLKFGDKLVANPGSVGLPRDGDPRACYAILDGRDVELKRIAYDVERTIFAVGAWGLPDGVARSLERLYRGERPEVAIGEPGRALS
jgi:diadenosine tetraphosphatase ApaH/serine/threonine PP2A family protein phosphatase